jgi:hypothetical protein
MSESISIVSDTGAWYLRGSSAHGGGLAAGPSASDRGAGRAHVSGGLFGKPLEQLKAAPELPPALDGTRGGALDEAERVQPAFRVERVRLVAESLSPWLAGCSPTSASSASLKV